jgi:hypothetical protein
VDEDPACVEDAAEPRATAGRQHGERQLDEVAGIRAGSDLLPGALERGARGGQRERARLGRQPLVAQELVDRGQVAESHTESIRRRTAPPA